MHEVQLRRIRGSTRYVLRQVRERGWTSSFFCGIGRKRGDRIRRGGMKKNEGDESRPRLAALRHAGIAAVQRGTLPGKKQQPRIHNLGRPAWAAPTFVILMILPA